MRILHINKTDISGGAAKVSWNLFKACQTLGYSAWLAVDNKKSDDPCVFEIPHRKDPTPPRGARALWMLHGRSEPFEKLVPGIQHVRYWIRTLASGGRTEVERQLGIEDFDFPATWSLLDLLPDAPDIVHAHNLYENYFDLRFLPRLSNQLPTVLTLHDAWLLSGHCAHSFDCERWKIGCGYCPDLTIYPAIQKDGTAYNWRRKRKILNRTRLYVSSPCQWLMDKVNSSILADSIVEARVIPNGVDSSVFHPYDQRQARIELGLPTDAEIILLTSALHIKNNIFKDYSTLREALERVALKRKGKKLLFIALGEDWSTEQVAHVPLHFVPYQNDDRVVARYYQASDVYAHAARADTFPNAVIEAMACSTPVVATAVGGIPEQIEDGVTGFLTPIRDSEVMASRIDLILNDQDLRLAMKAKDVETSVRRFNQEGMVKEYLGWYEEILASQRQFRKSVL